MRPRYQTRPIASIDALSQALRISAPILQHTAKNIADHYTDHVIPKKDGTDRQIVIPTQHLKIIQKRINKNIFGNVYYPEYLFGGIPEKDYVKNATHHAGCGSTICLDLKNFYPSIQESHVLSIFMDLFKFPKDVSELLTQLITLRGKIPQGACTSSHVANLILHDSEYHLVQNLSNRGFKYSRLLDDITISYSSFIKTQDAEKIIKNVAGILKKYNLKINNKKTLIAHRSNPVDLLCVTGLWLNRGTPRIDRQERREIRAEVHNCMKLATAGLSSIEYHEAFNRVSGRVAKLNYLKYPEAKTYRDALKKVYPIYNQTEVTKTIKLVDILEKSLRKKKDHIWFVKQYNNLNYRLGILSRTHSNLSKALRERLRKIAPRKTMNDLMYYEPI